MKLKLLKIQVPLETTKIFLLHKYDGVSSYLVHIFDSIKLFLCLQIIKDNSNFYINGKVSQMSVFFSCLLLFCKRQSLNNVSVALTLANFICLSLSLSLFLMFNS